ncbi:MAG: MipA/OmpV family protein [Jannaschia sp.]
MIRSLALIALLLPAVAQAQDMMGKTAPVVPEPIVVMPRTGPAIGFTLGAGVAVAPSYFGSDSYEAAPDLTFGLNYLRLGGFTFGNPDPLFMPEGFGITGSFRYIGERDDADDPELAGLADVDAALELGAGLRYATRNYQVFGNVRYGVVGHESFVGELGADVFIRPTDRLTLRAGPRAFFGDGDYASTYFGVTPAEAAASGGNFTTFDAGGGLLSAGLEVGAGYRINQNWGVDASIRYDRLENDAADSPISRDDDQFTASIGLTRRFTLGF